MAGPNGSGKSTILSKIRSNFYCGPLVNADDILKSLFEKGVINLINDYGVTPTQQDYESFVKHKGIGWMHKAEKEKFHINIKVDSGIIIAKDIPTPYDAALSADFIRNMLINTHQSFTFETVMSHDSKTDFLKHAIDHDFKNYLYFICTVDPAINIQRVKQRVEFGGHDVPPEKIESRFFKSLKVLSTSIPYLHRAYFFDNSSENEDINFFAEINPNKEIVLSKEIIPWWFEEHVIAKVSKSYKIVYSL